ncbi:hypothetical protein K4A83_16660 [Spirulina subsalsa FACHB-351]|uniref:Glycosyltransferase RgtA/B/C/D-like domain-containing protein n=1 Tax=Spirulina subsalsa FACHB-351 TaxID=234711 RepID=A0ABT3L8W1_9CYAN|nr:hypothetical protein [Spirulina subsalsa]MCW6037892.1 hypothetical protein [Spirulina subsalsa FACHB-351]
MLNIIKFRTLWSEQYLSRKQFPWLLAAFLFLLSYGSSLFYLNAIYWDDWVLFNVHSEYILEMFADAGAIFSWPGYLHIFLLLVGPEIYRLLTLVLMFASGYLLWLILRQKSFLKTLESNLITLLFLILPLNPARISLINFPYTLCYFCFFLAWWLLQKPSFNKKILSLGIFFFSFNINSFLVFYVLPVIDIFCKTTNFSLNVKTIKSFLKQYFLFLLIPFIFFYIKTSYFTPSGLYVGYNSVSWQGIKSSLVDFSPAVFIFILWLIFKILVKSFVTERGLIILFCGIITRQLAIFPYSVVGLTPSFQDWNSRHQLLMPLGVSLIVLGTVAWISYGRASRGVIIVLLLSSIINLYFSYEYYVDWVKQEKVIELISKSDEIKNARTIVFDDQTKNFNARGRVYRFYEYNGWLKSAFGDQTRFGVDLEEVKSRSPDGTLSYYPNEAFTELFSAANYQLSSPEIIVSIICSDSRLKALFTRARCFSLSINQYKM